MKYFVKFLYIAATVVLVVLLVNALRSESEINYKVLVESIIRIVGFLLIIFGIRRRRVIPHRSLYEKAYKDILQGVFANDKKSYNTLMEAISYFNLEEYKSALQLLDKLEKECKTTRDYTAVYTFRSLVYEDQKKPELAIEAYEKLLQYDMTNSTAWSNLGLCYRKMDRRQEAFEAYTNAIRFDPMNSMAYNNMACYYIYVGDGNKALEYALMALERDGKNHQAMQAASVAYKALGDDEAAERYCKMCGVNGGDEKQLRKLLQEM